MKNTPKSPLVLSIISTEGGSGKTTTAVNLAFQAWKTFGFKTLLIDLDSNRSLNHFLNANSHRSTKETAYCLFENDFSGELPLISVLDSDYNICLLPGHGDINPDLITTRRGKEKILKRSLPKSKNYEDFDLIILDNRGGIDSITTNSIAASTHLLLGSRVGIKSIDLAEALTEIIEINEELELDPEPDLLGIFLNDYQQSSKTHELIHKGTLEGLSIYEGLIVYPPIPYSGWIAQANATCRALGQVRPGDAINSIYKEIASSLVH